MRTLFFSTLSLLLIFQSVLTAQETPAMTIFEPGLVSLPDIRETSPTVTADGETLVFARTSGWREKVPYIAHKTDNGWEVEPLTFADTIYNLAISSAGNMIIYKQYEDISEDKSISHTYTVERTDDGWSEPVEQNDLYNINAGYFCLLGNGEKLYYFGRWPQAGIYETMRGADGQYSKGVLVSEAISIPNTTTFDALIHPDEDKLIVTRAGLSEEQAKELGERGYYLYEKQDSEWKEVKRLNLPYGWGATMWPDGKLMFVEAGDLQFVDIEELGFGW